MYGGVVSSTTIQAVDVLAVIGVTSVIIMIIAIIKYLPPIIWNKNKGDAK